MNFYSTFFHVDWLCDSVLEPPAATLGLTPHQDAKGDAEFAATIQSNLAAAYAKKGDHDKALAAAEEAWFGQ